MKTQPKQTIREKIEKIANDLFTHASFPGDGIEDIEMLIDDLLATLPMEEMKDEREIIARVCQGCQEVKSCCDCPSEKNRQCYNAHVDEVRRWKKSIMKELGGEKK